jgi:hypothetical protein
MAENLVHTVKACACVGQPTERNDLLDTMELGFALIALVKLKPVAPKYEIAPAPG